jgi:hypothetical protein
MNDDMDLDALFAEAAALPVAPSPVLTARILADAQALQARAPAQAVKLKPRFGLMGWLLDLAEGLGGGRAVAGLSLAGLTGLFLGVADPTALQSLTALIAGDMTMVGQMDLLPATDILWTEN